MFGSWAYSSREPRFSDLFSAEQAYSVPLFQHVDPAGGVHADPIARPEKVHDYEDPARGSREGAAPRHRQPLPHDVPRRAGRLPVRLQPEPTGSPPTPPSPCTRVWRSRASPGGCSAKQSALVLEANATFGDNHFVSFAEQIDSSTTIRHDGNTIAFFPNLPRQRRRAARVGAAPLRARGPVRGPDLPRHQPGRHRQHRAAHGARRESRPEPAARRRRDRDCLDVRVFNLLDREYETGGYFDYDDSGNYVRCCDARRDAQRDRAAHRGVVRHRRAPVKFSGVSTRFRSSMFDRSEIVRVQSGRETTTQGNHDSHHSEWSRPAGAIGLGRLHARGENQRGLAADPIVPRMERGR